MKILLVVILIILISSISDAQDAGKQIAPTAGAIEKQLATLKVSDDLKQQCTNDLAEARANLKQGRLYFSLYTLRTCQLELASLAYAEAKAELANKGADAFDAEWRHLGTTLTEKEKILASKPSKPLPAVITAIADVSRIQARPYYQSGRLFALNSNMSEGIYYTGRAPANLDFAIFCRSLNFPKPKEPLQTRSVEPELKKLESTALRTYKSADVSSLQSQYNRLNSNLKVAGELNAASMFEGALLKYLESKLYFGMLITAAEKEDVEHLRARSKEVANLLTTEKNDNTIGILFSQMADAALNPAGSAQPSAAQIKRAVVILNIVLPAYLDYVKEMRP
jgi:hypothetical protein